MSKRGNPLLKKTTPVEPEVLSPEPPPLNETFPGGATLEPPLSVREQKRLAECEAKVAAAIQGSVEAGYAIREIQEDRLHRATHDRFDEYISERWDMKRSHAYRLIDAVNVLDTIQNALPDIQSDVEKYQLNKNVPNWGHDLTDHDLKQIPLLPQNEAQARALAKYKNDPEQQIEIWKEALRTMKDGRMTASHIQATAQRLASKRVKKGVRKTRDYIRRARVSEAFRNSFKVFLDQINAERSADWKDTDPKEVARHLRGLLQAVEAPL